MAEKKFEELSGGGTRLNLNAWDYEDFVAFEKMQDKRLRQYHEREEKREYQRWVKSQKKEEKKGWL